MKMVQTVNGPVPVWRWNLKWWWRRQVSRIKALPCLWQGHVEFPEATSRYCTRCHKWNHGKGWDREST